LSANPTQGARIAVHEANADSTEWGRSCSSLESRFQNQQSRLVGAEGTAALVRSISWMRTLRRANARNCEWVTNGPGTSSEAAAEMAASYLRQSPCYEPAMAASAAAQNLPEEARVAAMEEVWAILLSENAECTSASAEAPELNESDEELEEELDDETDEVMEQLATQPSETSLIQNEQLPVVGLWSWGFAVGLGWPFVIGSIVVGILLGMFCTHLVHMIVRIFRWIRCRVLGNSCSEYAPATWFRVLARGGCSLTGMFFGPLGLLYGTAGAVGTVAGIAGAAR